MFGIRNSLRPKKPTVGSSLIGRVRVNGSSWLPGAVTGRSCAAPVSSVGQGNQPWPAFSPDAASPACHEARMIDSSEIGTIARAAKEQLAATASKAE